MPDGKTEDLELAYEVYVGEPDVSITEALRTVIISLQMKSIGVSLSLSLDKFEYDSEDAYEIANMLYRVLGSYFLRVKKWGRVPKTH